MSNRYDPSHLTIEEINAIIDEIADQMADMRVGQLPVVSPALMTDDMEELANELTFWCKAVEMHDDYTETTET